MVAYLDNLILALVGSDKGTHPGGSSLEDLLGVPNGHFGLIAHVHGGVADGKYRERLRLKEVGGAG